MKHLISSLCIGHKTLLGIILRFMDDNISVFFELVRAGLWETEVRLSQYNRIDFNEVYRLAEEQSVVGLVAAGIDRIVDITVPQKIALTFVGSALQLEQRNNAMNDFVAKLTEKLHEKDIYALLLKGQGIAQCYERPLWRASGDIDLLLDGENYEKAKKYLIPLTNSVEKESVKGKHLGMNIGQWVVELHGHLYCGLSKKTDMVIDDTQKDVLCANTTRLWLNGQTLVFLPNVDNDVIFVFTHFLKHFYKGGLGLRQICDWCRLLFTYRESLKHELLELRIRKAGLMTEWQAFGAFAVEMLGMPIEAMPMYSSASKWQRKALRIQKFVLMSGNMGHNRDTNYRTYPFLLRKTFSMGRRIVDMINHAQIFLIDSLRFFPSIMMNGVKSAAKGVG